jgi:hypothetical protein
MAEVIAKAGVDPASLERLCFVVLAPQYSIDKGTFTKELNPESIQSKVKKRVNAYGGQLDDWYENAFKPTFDHIKVKSLSWESTLDWICDHNPGINKDLRSFYNLCLEFK